ncbi:sigma factor [Streptomyces sp. NPDC054796]
MNDPRHRAEGAEADAHTGAVPDAQAYARVYEEEHPGLVSYARTLTANRWLAEDLVAEAHFRVWRRISSGYEVENVPAYLRTVVRNLALTVGAAQARETPRGLAPGSGPGAGSGGDPGQRVAYVDLLARVLEQLPERQVKALWLAEAEDQPLEAVGRTLGSSRNATAVLLHRAREGLRQGFLRQQPGTPRDAACAAHWERLPAHVRGMGSDRATRDLERHLGECADCRERMALLMRANDRLPALVGPALLVVLAGGGAKVLAALAGAGAASGSDAGSGSSGSGSGSASGSGGSGVSGVVLGPLRFAREAVGRLPTQATVGVVGLAAVGTVAVAGLAVTGHGQPAGERAQGSGGSTAPPSSSYGGADGSGERTPGPGSADPTETTGHPDTRYPRAESKETTEPAQRPDPAQRPESAEPEDSTAPSDGPASHEPPDSPSDPPPKSPSGSPSDSPATDGPSDSPTPEPSRDPSDSPSDTPSDSPSGSPSGSPSEEPSSPAPSPSPSHIPERSPTPTAPTGSTTGSATASTKGSAVAPHRTCVGAHPVYVCQYR